MNINIKEFKDKAKLIRSTDVYNVYDLKLPTLTLSLTELHPLHNTKGHSHDADEVYFFISGIGEIEIGDSKERCEPERVFVIPRNAFHKVFNMGVEDLKFWCVFENYGQR